MKEPRIFSNFLIAGKLFCSRHRQMPNRLNSKLILVKNITRLLVPTCICGHAASKFGSSSSGSYSAPLGLLSGGNDRKVFNANCKTIYYLIFIYLNRKSVGERCHGNIRRLETPVGLYFLLRTRMRISISRLCQH